MQEHVIGEIVDIDEAGVLTIRAPVPDIARAIVRKYKTAEIILPDGRRISPEQRRKCYALLGEIAEYVDGVRNAETVDEQKELLKLNFMLERMESTERKMFSLADCDMSTAREFITYLIDFIIRNDIPTRVPLVEQCEDIQRYVYACLLNKKCAICGRRADLHHVDAIGMGNNRREVSHIGRKALPLCREHHTEIHASGLQQFLDKYHLETVEIDKKIAKVYGLKK